MVAYWSVYGDFSPTLYFTFFVPCVVIQLRNGNQQNAHFNSIPLVCYMFRTSYAYLQEHNIVHAALYGMFSMHVCKQSVILKDVLDKKTRIELQH